MPKTPPPYDTSKKNSKLDPLYAHSNWTLLGQGSYNKAYKSNDGLHVLKIQTSHDKTDSPERSIRLWNLINDHIPPPARLATTAYGSGWICPFLEGVQASDEEMAEAVITIFNKTGRIIADATAPKNFLRTPSGQIVCIDIGMALQIDAEENKHLAHHARRISIVSFNTWTNLKDQYEPFFQTCTKTNPVTVNTVKALIFIKEYRPDILDASYLIANPNLVKILADAYSHKYYGSANSYKQNTNDVLLQIGLPMPQERAIADFRGFADYLREQYPHLTITDNQIPGVTLSAPYQKEPGGNTFINMMISTPDMRHQFKKYIQLQAQLAQARLRQQNTQPKQEPEVIVEPEPKNAPVIENKYQYKTEDKGRIHMFSAAIPDTEEFQGLREHYGNLRGDQLKTKILEDLQNKIQNADSLQALEAIKETREYKNAHKILAKGQGLFTRITHAKTSSIIALEEMFEQKTDSLLNPNSGPG